MEFQIIRQTDPNHGCVPACARSVLQHAGLPTPTETELVAAMYPSGFTLLAYAFRALGLDHKIVIDPAPVDVENRIVELNARGAPVLFPVRGSAGAHCLVALGCSAAKAVLYDPADGKAREFSWNEARSFWTGDIAHIVTGQP